jgi:hypothetical protein
MLLLEENHFQTPTLLMKDWDKETVNGSPEDQLISTKRLLFKLIKKNKYEVAVNFDPKHISV